MTRRAVRRARALVGALACALLVPGSASAQGATDLFLVELREADGRLAAGAVTRLTNRDGYDNQPHFTPDGTAILYTTIDAAGQADIARYDLTARRATHVTRTAPESEYSATPMPGGGRFSAIRVETDSTQRLWSFALDGSDARVVLEDIAPVGYHAWIDADRVAIFVLGDPATLRIADVRTGRADVVASDIGRSLHRIPGSTRVSFVHRDGADGPGRIRAFDPETGAIETLVSERADNEYHAWTPAGTLLSASGSRLYAWRPGSEATWVEVANLAEAGVSNISRLAVSPDGTRLALVAAHEGA